jgi:hypothetical protein
VPLVTDNINEARTAYAALENRAAASDTAYAQLRASLDDLRGRQLILAPLGDQLRQSATDQAARNAQLSAQHVVSVSPDMTLGEFVAQIGLAAALGEATMPDRVIPAISCSVQTYVAVDAPSGGGPRFALRFHHPELGDASGLSTTTFQIQRTPPAPGAPVTPSLYAVLIDKQQLYALPAFAGMAPATQILVLISGLLSAPETWTVAGLAASGASIAAQEQALAPLIQSAAPQAAAALKTAADALLALSTPLQAKPTPVAGDLLELTAGLYVGSKAARGFVGA